MKVRPLDEDLAREVDRSRRAVAVATLLVERARVLNAELAWRRSLRRAPAAGIAAGR